MAAGDVTIDFDDVMGTENVVGGSVAYGTAVSGGIALGLKAKFGLTTVRKVFFEQANGYVFAYDKAADKLKVFQSAGSAAALAEVTSGDLTSAGPVSFLAFGKK